MAENTLGLVAEVIKTLADAHIKTWLFGGWAEELLEIRPAGLHKDIDLLYPAQDFDLLDNFLQTQTDMSEVLSKRFGHKRAFQWRTVLVEVFLVRSEAAGFATNFFDTYQFAWPQDTFSASAQSFGRQYLTASSAALRHYREQHENVEQAYQQYAAKRNNRLAGTLSEEGSAHGNS